MIEQLFGQSSDLRILLRKFIEQKLGPSTSFWQYFGIGDHSPSKTSPTQQLYEYISGSDEKKSLVLFKVIGLGHFNTVIVRLKPLPKAWCERTLKELIGDMDLILLHNIENVKAQNPCFKPLPATEGRNYSWNVNNSLFDSRIAALDSKNAQARVLVFFQTVEFPLQLAQIFNVFPSKLLGKSLLKEHAKANKAIQEAYKMLNTPPLFQPSRPSLTKSKKIIHFQMIWLRYAATVEVSGGGLRLVSFAEEIGRYAAGFSDYAEEVSKHLKLFLLVDFTAEKIFSPSHGGEKESIGMFPFDRSFKHHMIKKTLTAIQNTFPVSSHVYGELARLFEKSEENRRLVCFCMYLFYDIFQPNQSLLKMFLRVGEGTRRHQILEIAEVAVGRILDGVDEQIAFFIKSLMYAFCMDNRQQVELSLKMKGAIWAWSWARVTKQRELDCVSTLIMFEQLYICAPENLYQVIFETFFVLDASQQQMFSRGISQMNLAFLNRFEGGFCSSTEFLKEWSEYKETKIYYFLELYWQLLIGCYYLDLNYKSQKILFEHLFASESEERKQYEEELRNHIVGMKLEKGNLTVVKEKYLETGIQKFSESNLKNKTARTTLKEWPKAYVESTHAEVQVKMIYTLETQLNRNGLPLTTVLNILAYQIFFEEALVKLNNLVDLRMILLSEENRNRFFLPPSLVAKKHKWLSAIQIHSLSALQFPQQPHLHMFDRALAPFYDHIREAVLPHPHFKKTLAKSIAILFKGSDPRAIEDARMSQTQFREFSKTQSNNIVYTLQWKIKENYPCLEFTFFSSLHRLKSTLLEIPLKLTLEELEAPLMPLFQAMIKHLFFEIEDKTYEGCLIDGLTDEEKRGLTKEEEGLGLTEEKELLRYLRFAIFSKVKDAWEAYVSESDAPNKMDMGCRLFNFIKRTKIKLREALMSLFNPVTEMIEAQEIEAQPLIRLVCRGHIYPTADGLSLIPPRLFHLDAQQFYQIKKSSAKRIHELGDYLGALSGQLGRLSQASFEYELTFFERLLALTGQTLVVPPEGAPEDYQPTKEDFDRIDGEDFKKINKDQFKKEAAGFYDFIIFFLDLKVKGTDLQIEFERFLPILKNAMDSGSGWTGKEFLLFNEDLKSLMHIFETKYEDFEKEMIEAYGNEIRIFEGVGSHRFGKAINETYPINARVEVSYQKKDGFHYQVTFAIQAESYFEYSMDLKHFAGHRELKNLLFWMFGKNVSLFYRNWLDEALPHSHIGEDLAKTILVLFYEDEKDLVEPRLIQQRWMKCSKGTSNGIIYNAQWMMQEDHPILELTLVSASSVVKSVSLTIPVGVAAAQLDRTVKFLFQSLIKHLFLEQADIFCEGLGENLLTDLNRCREIFPDLDEKWRIAYPKASDDTEVGCRLFSFVRRVKSELTDGLMRLLDPIDPWSMKKEFFPEHEKSRGEQFMEWVCQGQLYSTSEGLSLIPPHFSYLDTDKFYLVEEKSVIEKIEEIREYLKEFSPNLEGEKGKDKNDHKDIFEKTMGLHQFGGTEEYWIYAKVESNYEEKYGYQYRVTFTVQAEEPFEYSMLFKYILNYSHLDRLLFWMLGKTVSLYYIERIYAQRQKGEGHEKGDF